MMKNTILDRLIKIKPKLKKDGIVIIGIFGSYARGDYNDNSDIDILYELNNPKKFAQENGIRILG